MIAVITIILISIIVLIKVYITNKENNIRIKELEQRLDEFYKRRENNLMNKFRDIEGK